MPHSTSPASDAERVESLRRGDPGAFEELVRTEGPQLLAVARRMLRNEEDARDAVQETFTKTFQRIGDFSGQSKLATWMHRIAVNEALMRMRSRRRKPESAIEDLLPLYQENGHPVEPAREWGEPADRALQREEVRDLVRESIDRLPESYRTVLLLRDIEGLPLAEISEALGATVNATKIRLHRARQALRNLLDPHMRGATA